jgi:hypothetical protein
MTDKHLSRLNLTKNLTELEISETKISEVGLKSVLQFNKVLKKLVLRRCHNVEDQALILISEVYFGAFEEGD